MFTTVSENDFVVIVTSGRDSGREFTSVHIWEKCRYERPAAGLGRAFETFTYRAAEVPHIFYIQGAPKYRTLSSFNLKLTDFDSESESEPESESVGVGCFSRSRSRSRSRQNLPTPTDSGQALFPDSQKSPCRLFRPFLRIFLW